METRFDFKVVESKWSASWEENGVFHARGDGSKPVFTIVIPPPNVTSHLHLGHAFQNTFLDLLVRWKKMQGYDTCWVPGVDHAGIATQNVVERELRKEKLSRHDLGREKFVERVWAWKKEYGARITNQLRRLGYALDWPRERFTMDEGLSRAVTEQFVRFYEEGLIYRDYRIIHWCPRCETALSDMEVEYEDVQGALYHILYPESKSGLPDVAEWDSYGAALKALSQGSGLTVATTRPETLLGDTAVAINPEDKRHKGWGGKNVHLPLTGRVITVIQDSYVDVAFGTGVLKVTPAHDPNDFALGKKHKLEMKNIFTTRAKINEEGGRYKGLNREDARKKILEDLNALGLLKKTEPITHRVGHCSRCKAVVEALHSKQWFLSMKGMADAALEAARKGEVRFHPENWIKTYEHWLENIRDWCLSRQLWWGHRIPVYFCEPCSETVVAREAPSKCPKCGGAMKQDEDVLDTWFSSNMWPFSVFGWPEQTKDLKTFYPTSVLGTGWDILPIWVAKMIMTGIHLTGKVPFRDVYLNSLVGDEHGKKMSKSSGTAVDPLKVIDEYGADCLRFALVASETRTHYIPFSVDRVRGYRNFVTKIWNATRFALQYLEANPNVDGGQAPNTRGQATLPLRLGLSPMAEPAPIGSAGAGDPNRAPSPSGRGEGEGGFELWDHWIWSKLIQTAKTTQDSFEGYRFNEAALSQADFFWHQLCDVYLETLKFRFRAEDAARAATARVLLDGALRTSMKLMHPIMPFVTEEIYSLLPRKSGMGTGSSLSQGTSPHAKYLSERSWPEIADLESVLKPDPARVADAEFILALAQQIRTLRSDAKVHPKDPTPVRILAPTQSRLAEIHALQEVQELLNWETRGGAVNLAPSPSPLPKGEGTAPDPLRGCVVVLNP